jgi:hypothetical protein
LKLCVEKLSNEMKERVRDAARTKDRFLNEKKVAGRKRKRLEFEWARRIRRRVNESKSNDEKERVGELIVI